MGRGLMFPTENPYKMATNTMAQASQTTASMMKKRPKPKKSVGEAIGVGIQGAMLGHMVQKEFWPDSLKTGEELDAESAVKTVGGDSAVEPGTGAVATPQPAEPAPEPVAQTPAPQPQASGIPAPQFKAQAPSNPATTPTGKTAVPEVAPQNPVPAAPATPGPSVGTPTPSKSVLGGATSVVGMAGTGMALGSVPGAAAGALLGLGAYLFG